MGFFNNETKEQKDQREAEKFLRKYNLESIDQNDLEIVKGIAQKLLTTEMLRMTVMSNVFKKPEDKLMVSYLSALVEQNWMMMNQLSRINDNLEKLLEK